MAHSEAVCGLRELELRDSFSAGLTNAPASEIISGQIQLEVKVIKVK